MNREETEKFYRVLEPLSDTEIRKRLASHEWGADKKRAAEQLIESREKARHLRFTEQDRNVQRWILRVAIIGVIVALVGVGIGVANLIYFQ